MVKTEDVVKYIERVYGCDLYDYQVKLLDNMIHGKITDVPRNCGKSFLIKGYADYLNYVHDMCKYNSAIKIDDYISGEEVLKTKTPLLSSKLIKQAFLTNPDNARRDYNIEFTSIVYFDEEAFK